MTQSKTIPAIRTQTAQCGDVYRGHRIECETDRDGDGFAYTEMFLIDPQGASSIIQCSRFAPYTVSDFQALVDARVQA